MPAHIVYEDSKVMAFLDIFPVNKGHILIIPKNHFETIFDLHESIARQVMSVAKILSKALKKAGFCSGVNLVNSSGKSANQEVMHFHLHVVPRNKGDNTGFKWIKKRFTEKELKESAEQIKQNL